ncbi:MAG: glycosyltransferase family 4 protein [Psychrobacter sp.]|nr:glycosyltransferase family 4 protein [Psychrobacter sp.]
MKFMIIASHLPSILNFRGKLLERIAKLGYDVHVLAPHLEDHPQIHSAISDLGYHVHQIPMQRTGTNPIADVKTLHAIYGLIKKVKPNYVLGYTIKPVIYGMLAAAHANVPHRFALITGLGYAFAGAEDRVYKKSTLQKLMHYLYSKALASTQKVFFQNPDDEALFKEMAIIQPTLATKVVNGSGVDIDKFAVEPIPMAEGEPLPRFLLIGRLLQAKGVREYAQAAAIIKAKYPQAQFDLVGFLDENPDAILQSELDDWVNQGLLTFWGKLKDVRPAIAACSVYVLPSYREGTPRSVLEAMAMGRAVITTDTPGCRETVIDGYNGYLVPVKSVEGLVVAMEQLIKQPQQIAEMGAASRRLAEDKYEVHTVNKVMIKEMGILEKNNV